MVKISGGATGGGASSAGVIAGPMQTETYYGNPPVQNTWYQVHVFTRARIHVISLRQRNTEAGAKNVAIRITDSNGVTWEATAQLDENLSYYVHYSSNPTDDGVDSVVFYIDDKCYPIIVYNVDVTSLADFDYLKVQVRITSVVGTAQKLTCTVWNQDLK